jgi:hypothetical protein
MISKEVYECAIRYYEINTEMSSKEKINNIKIIFEISQTSFFRYLKDSKKTNNNSKRNPKRDRRSRYKNIINI